jgi:hypothetical protein
MFSQYMERLKVEGLPACNYNYIDSFKTFNLLKNSTLSVGTAVTTVSIQLTKFQFESLLYEGKL